jgi:single-strand DNA-binding protein
MRTINKVILIGNVVKDPTIKMTMGGKKIAMFTVATNHVVKLATGETRSEAEYTSCSAWGSYADLCEQYLRQGKLVYVEGRLHTRVIDKGDMNKIYKTEVSIQNLVFLSKRTEEEEYGEDRSHYHHRDSDEFSALPIHSAQTSDL